MGKTSDINIENLPANVMINGGFDYWQRGISFLDPAHGLYTADRWLNANILLTGNMDITRSTDLPPELSELDYSMKIEVAVAESPVPVDRYAFMTYRVEGNLLKNFRGGTKEFIHSFWVKSSKIGTYAINYSNHNRSRSLVRKYTIDVANEWQKIIIIDLKDEVGVWNYDTTIGLTVEWQLAIGSDFDDSSEEWIAAAGLKGHPDQVNFFENLGETFYLAGTMFVDADSGEIPFRRAGRDIFDELTKCQRYYEKSYDINIIPGTTSTGGNHVFLQSSTFLREHVGFKVRKRAQPAIVIYNQITGTIGEYRTGSGANVAATATDIGETSWRLNSNAHPAGSDGLLQWTADAEL